MARLEKFASQIKREVSTIIHDELKDPRLGFVTITGVEVTHDLRNAKICYSVYGKDEDHTKTQEALDSALGYIRRLIGQRIKLQYVPEIAFKEDHSSEYSSRIEEILNEIKESDEPQAPRPRPKKA
jgi:ribosome-binding factor A